MNDGNQSAQACVEPVRNMLEQTDGLICGVVATSDGFPVHEQASEQWELSASRLAAMASSGHAMGDSVAQEFTETECQDVIINSGRVTVVFLAVPSRKQSLILCAAAEKSVNLATLLVAARTCAREVAEAIA